MLERKRTVGSSSSGASKMRQSKRQVPKETFHKWQWTYMKEHQSMTMARRLQSEMDDQGKSLVSTLWCVVCQQYETRICRQYETRICGPKNFSRAWTNSSSNHKTSNINDHANSEPHKGDMIYLCTFTCYCIYCTLLLYNVSMKCVRSTFCNGRSSYSVV